MKQDQIRQQMMGRQRCRRRAPGPVKETGLGESGEGCGCLQEGVCERQEEWDKWVLKVTGAFRGFVS